MVLPEQFNEAEARFPLPGIVNWYRYKFPARQYIIAGAVIVLIGVILTGFDMSKLIRAIPTLLVCIMLLIVAPIGLTVFILTKITMYRRAKYLGMKYRNYIKALENGTN